MTESSSNRSRVHQYKEAHITFLQLWADGLHPLEIAQIMGLSKQQTAKHTLDAFLEHAPRQEPEYECEFWETLPQRIKAMLPGQNGQIVTIEGDEKGLSVILTLKGSQPVGTH